MYNAKQTQTLVCVLTKPWANHNAFHPLALFYTFPLTPFSSPFPSQVMATNSDLFSGQSVPPAFSNALQFTYTASANPTLGMPVAVSAPVESAEDAQVYIYIYIHIYIYIYIYTYIYE